MTLREHKVLVLSGNIYQHPQRNVGTQSALLLRQYNPSVVYDKRQIIFTVAKESIIQCNDFHRRIHVKAAAAECVIQLNQVLLLAKKRTKSVVFVVMFSICHNLQSFPLAQAPPILESQLYLPLLYYCGKDLSTIYFQ